MRQFFRFLRENILGAIMMAVGGILAVASRVRDIYEAMTLGLPTGAWEAFGLVIFFVGVVTVLYRMNTQLAAGAAPPTSMRPQPAAHLKDIRNQTFKGTNVLLDGNRYVSCTFDDCTIQWNGGQFDVVDPKWANGWKFATANDLIARTMGVMRWLKLMDQTTVLAHAKVPK